MVEPFFDWMGFIWQVAIHHWTVVSMFGHHEPRWMFGVYYWYVGGQTVFPLGRLRARATRRELWALYGIFCAVDTLLELPVLDLGGVYTYFGRQPLRNASWFPLPGWNVVVNGLLP